MNKISNLNSTTFKTWDRIYSNLMTPHSNTGETKAEGAIVKGGSCSLKDYPVSETMMVLTDKGVKPVLFRRPASDEIAVIDWLNVSMSKDTFTKDYEPNVRYLFDNDYIICLVGEVLKDILDLNIEKKLDKGLMFYQETYTLEHDAGFVCIGGQRDTILISLSGQGCALAKYGWEQDFYEFLLTAERAKITRIDYAFDDLNGEYFTVDWADKQDSLGGFTCSNVAPEIEHRGNWKRPNDKGRTLYIGKRTSSKFCRVYEKGKQLGDKDSLWTRVEVEYKGKDFFIPFSALINCTEHFIAAYPCFSEFESKKKPVKFDLIARKTEITVNRAIEVIQVQFGKYLRFFRDYFDTDKEVLDCLQSVKCEYPKKISSVVVHWYDEFKKSMPVHALPS